MLFCKMRVQRYEKIMEIGKGKMKKFVSLQEI